MIQWLSLLGLQGSGQHSCPLPCAVSLASTCTMFSHKCLQTVEVQVSLDCEQMKCSVLAVAWLTRPLLCPQFAAWVDAVVFVFSLEDEISFQTVYNYFLRLSSYRNTAEVPMVLVGTQGARLKWNQCVYCWCWFFFFKGLQNRRLYLFILQLNEKHNIYIQDLLIL